MLNEEQAPCSTLHAPRSMIDHTERRHDVTFISVEVESQDNRCTILYRSLAKENIVYASILWNFHRKTDEISITWH
jgi:glutathione peroxidase-family protein